MVETLAELLFIGDQVDCLSHDQAAPQWTGIGPPAPAKDGCPHRLVIALEPVTGPCGVETDGKLPPGGSIEG
jgi:hypothetical protein